MGDTYITVRGDNVNGSKSGGDNISGDKYEIHPGAPGPDDGVPVRNILLLSANPSGQQPLRLDEERRAIDRVVAASPAAGQLAVRTADALRLDDLQEALLRHRPVIAHFSGHGHPTAGIQAVDEFGHGSPVPPRALTGLFQILRGGLRCVVLNACHTDEQAEAIAAHVPCVVGMRRQILDDTAILFATGFYRAIANGRSVRAAFELACNGLDLHGIADRDVPRLIAGSPAVEWPVVPSVTPPW